MKNSKLNPFQTHRSTIQSYDGIGIDVASASLLAFSSFSLQAEDKDLALYFGLFGSGGAALALVMLLQSYFVVKRIRKYEHDFKRGKHSVTQKEATLNYYAKIYGQGQRNFKLTDVSVDGFDSLKITDYFGKTGVLQQGRGLTNTYSIKKKFTVHQMIGKFWPYLLYDEDVVIWVRE